MSATKTLRPHHQSVVRLRRRARPAYEHADDQYAAVDLRLPAPVAGGQASPASAGPSLARSLGPNAVLALQRTHGNRHVQRLLAGPHIQRCGGDTACGCADCAESEEREPPSAPAQVAPQRVQRQTGGQPTLRLGSKSPSVATLQQKLGIAADGIFGPATHKAVVAFQQGAGLTPDGIVGPKTWAGLGAGAGAGATPPGPGAGPTASEAKGILLLAKLGEVRSALNSLDAKTGAPGAAAETIVPGLSLDDPSVTAPVPLSYGWLDDATEWAEEKAGAATDWVEEKAEGAGEWVGEQVDAATDWVGEQAGAAGGWIEEQVDSASGWVEEHVDAASDWVEEKVDQGAKWVGDTADKVSETASGVAAGVQRLAEGLKEKYKEEIKVLEEIVKTVGQPIGLGPDEIDAAIIKLDGVLDNLAAQHSDPTNTDAGTTAGGSTNITNNPTTHTLSAANIRAAFADPKHRGSTKPNFPPSEKPELTLGSDSKVESATLNVRITKSLPNWTEVGDQCQKAQEAWAAYISALTFHEGKHVTIYTDYFTANNHTQFLGKTESAAATRFRAMKSESKGKNDDLDVTTEHGKKDTPSTIVPDPGC